MRNCPSCGAPSSSALESCWDCGAELKRPGLLRRWLGLGGSKRRSGTGLRDAQQRVESRVAELDARLSRLDWLRNELQLRRLRAQAEGRESDTIASAESQLEGSVERAEGIVLRWAALDWSLRLERNRQGLLALLEQSADSESTLCGDGTLEGHRVVSARTQGGAIAPSFDGRFLVEAFGGELRVWDAFGDSGKGPQPPNTVLPGGEPSRGASTRGLVSEIYFCPDSRLRVAADDCDLLIDLRVAGGAPRRDRIEAARRRDGVYLLALTRCSERGMHLPPCWRGEPLSGSQLWTRIQVPRLGGDWQLRQWEGGDLVEAGSRRWAEPGGRKGDDEAPETLCLGNHDALVASAGAAGLALFERGAEQPRFRLTREGRTPPFAVTFSPDDALLAAAGDGLLRIFSTDTGELLTQSELAPGGGEMRALRSSEDAHWLQGLVNDAHPRRPVVGLTRWAWRELGLLGAAASARGVWRHALRGLAQLGQQPRMAQTEEGRTLVTQHEALVRDAAAISLLLLADRVSHVTDRGLSPQAQARHCRQLLAEVGRAHERLRETPEALRPAKGEALLTLLPEQLVAARLEALRHSLDAASGPAAERYQMLAREEDGLTLLRELLPDGAVRRRVDETLASLKELGDGLLARSAGEAMGSETPIGDDAALRMLRAAAPVAGTPSTGPLLAAREALHHSLGTGEPVALPDPLAARAAALQALESSASETRAELEALGELEALLEESA